MLRWLLETIWDPTLLDPPRPFWGDSPHKKLRSRYSLGRLTNANKYLQLLCLPAITVVSHLWHVFQLSSQIYYIRNQSKEDGWGRPRPNNIEHDDPIHLSIIRGFSPFQPSDVEQPQKHPTVVQLLTAWGGRMVTRGGIGPMQFHPPIQGHSSPCFLQSWIGFRRSPLISHSRWYFPPFPAL